MRKKSTKARDGLIMPPKAYTDLQRLLMACNGSRPVTKATLEEQAARILSGQELQIVV